MWSSIEREAHDFLKSMHSVWQKLGLAGELLEAFMDDAKQTHRIEAFSYEIGLLKSNAKGSMSEIKKAISNAGRRCLCR